MLDPKIDFLVPFFYISYRNKYDKEGDGDGHKYMLYIAFFDLSQF